MTKLSKFGGWGGYPGERSHYWTHSYTFETADKPRTEQDFRWLSFCGQAQGGPDTVKDAPEIRPTPKRAGKCYACYQFLKA